MKLALALLAVSLATIASAELKVAALHPLIGNLVRDVGGKQVTVLDLVKPGGDIHHFEPSTKDIAALKGTHLIFASGKHIETYLDNLRDSVGTAVKIIETGKPVPSIKIEKGHEIFMCCPSHAAGGIDPHWWHSADGMRRAARLVAEELAAADPANAATYETNAAVLDQRLAALKS